MAGRQRLLLEENLEMIANRVSGEIGRPLDQLEIKALISHVKRLDGDIFLHMPINDAVDRVARGYMTYTATKNETIIDTHEVMKQYIGGGVKVSPERFTIQKNAGTGNGMPDDPASYHHQAGHYNAYAMFPAQNGMPPTVTSRAGVQMTEGMTSRAPLPQYSHPNVLANARGAIPSNAPALYPSADPQEVAEQQYAASQQQSQQPQYPDPIPKTLPEEEYLLTREGKDDDIAGIPVQGAYVKKNNIIKPRVKHVPILLDSRYRARSATPNTFLWSLSSSPSDALGIVSAQSTMPNTIEMRFSEFFIPYVPQADNSYKKITLLIEDLGMSSIMCHENRHYHMMFDTEIVTNRIRLIPENGGKYKFNEPIDYFRKISLSFADPLVPISFLPDDYPIVVVYNAPNSTYLVFNTPHNVSDGEVVLISGFTTANPQVDFAAISAINSPTGNVVDVIDDVTLEISVDLTGITLLTTPPSVDAYITSRRIFVPIVFSYVI